MSTNCNCGCNQPKTRKEWIQEYENQPASQKTGILDGAGKYDAMMAQKRREEERERRNQWRG